MSDPYEPQSHRGHRAQHRENNECGIGELIGVHLRVTSLPTGAIKILSVDLCVSVPLW
jgi:hypothetical protein